MSTDRIRTTLDEMAAVLGHGGPPVTDDEVVAAWVKLYRLVHPLRDHLASQPRSWSLPEQPDPEVTALRCECHGVWERLAKWPDRWRWQSYLNGWAELYKHIPLTDATPKAE